MATGTLDGIMPFMERTSPQVRGLPRYESGLSAEYVRAHYDVTEIAKLGSNENPYGPSRHVRNTVAQAVDEIGIYPEPSCDGLRAALSDRLDIAPERFIFGNGSEDLIAVTVHTFVSRGDHVVTFAPSFGLHVIWPQSVGADIHVVTVKSDYQIDVNDVLAAITPTTRLVLFGNPSNPVGTSLTADDLRRILSHLSPETLLLFDEAYLEYASADPAYPDFLEILKGAQTPWLILRTFSKAYGLAGLRVGYAIASNAELISLMDRVRAPFNVNRMAQIAAIAALEDMAYVQQVVAQTVEERNRVRTELEGLGYVVAPSMSNFLFVKSRENASELAERLLKEGVIVKPWREAGFSDHLRVSTGTPEANDQFLRAWKALAR